MIRSFYYRSIVARGRVHVDAFPFVIHIDLPLRMGERFIHGIAYSVSFFSSAGDECLFVLIIPSIALSVLCQAV